MSIPNHSVLDQLDQHNAPESYPPALKAELAAALEAASMPTPRPAATPPSTQHYVTFNTALLMCFLTAAVAFMLAIYAPVIAAKRGITLPGTSVGTKVVYLDFDKLMSEGMKRALATPTSGQEVQAQADKFKNDLTAAIESYVNAGYLVINSKALIRPTESQDITDAVLKTIGLK